MSWIDQHGEWESRKISLFGVARSFINQLSIGQDLTKVSLPSLFLYPYSGLELAGVRGLLHVNYLLKANEEFDEVKRFLHIIRYFLTIHQKEKFEKKPYNPILAETHIVHVDANGSPVIFLAEQVSHHPPVSAYIIEAKKEKIRIKSNIAISTKFHGNSASINFHGFTRYELGLHGEVYEIAGRPHPDFWIKNMILGTRRETWDGEITISCAKTNVRCTLVYKEEGWYSKNYLYGTVFKDNKEVLHIKGLVGDVFYMAKPEVSVKDFSTEGEVLLDMKNSKELKMEYLPEEQWDERSSLKVWKDVGKAIVDDDMPKADAAKRIIEESQRKRRNEGKSYETVYFKLDPNTNHWEFQLDSTEYFIRQKDGIVDDVLAKKLASVDIKENSSERAPSPTPSHKQSHKE